MKMTLKKKYTSRHEPDKWKNQAGKKNCTMWNKTSSGGQGIGKTKNANKPRGFSGRTIGKLQRRFSTDTRLK